MQQFTNDDTSTRVAIRIPTELAEQLREIAVRDANGISATARRLLAAGIAREMSARG